MNQQSIDQTAKLRDKHTFSIRRQEKLEIIRKSREVQPTQSQTNAIFKKTIDPELSQHIEKVLKCSFTLQNFIHLVKACYSNDIKQQLYGVIGIRKLMTASMHPPIQAVIDANLVPRLISFLKSKQVNHLILESIWCLANVSAGTTSQCQSVIQKGGLPQIIKHLNNDDPDIVQQAIWTLGNIAGDCPHYRDTILRTQCLDRICNIVMRQKIQSLILNGAWCLANLCRGIPAPKFQYVRNSIQPLCKVLKMDISDKQLLIDISWALSYLTQKKNRIKLILDTGVTPHIIKLLNSSDLKLLVPITRNIAFDKSQNIIKRQICWSLSNIAGTTQTLTDELIQCNSLFAKVFNNWNKAKTQIKKEIVWTIKNICMTGNSLKIIEFIKRFDLLQMIVSQLGDKDTSYVQVLLETLFQILNIEIILQMQVRPFYNKIFEMGADETIQKLQYSSSQQVYKKATCLLERCFELQTPL